MAVKTYSLKKDGDRKLTENFSVREFACADGSDEILIDTELTAVLQKIRDFFGRAVRVNSAYRTPAHNAKVGGASNSYHLRGQAADVVVSGVSPKRVAQYAEVLGALGVGCYDNKKFTHIDTRKNRVFWHYGAAGGISYVKTFSDCPYAEPGQNLGFGDTGAAWIQWHLKKCGARLAIDGKFGINTKAAVIAFQKKHALAADGIVGPKTRQQLKIEVI